MRMVNVILYHLVQYIHHQDNGQTQLDNQGL